MMTTPGKDKRTDQVSNERAPQVSRWLDLIRPHLGHYGRLPRGAQKKYLEELSAKTKTSVKTLRGFLAAAQYLEANGIREFPERIKRMPVASVEAIRRISKVDPEYAKHLLEMVADGRDPGARGLQGILKKLSKHGPNPRSAELIDEKRLREDLSKFGPFATVREFEFSNVSSILFDRLAYPLAIAYLSEGKRVAIFDESGIAWEASPDKAKKEFIRNIAVALTVLDYVLVYCTSMRSDLDELRSSVRENDRNRIEVRIGILEKPEGGAWQSPYARRFAQGATFSPRLMFVVDPADVWGIGAPAGTIAVRSSRSDQEKAPWKSMPPMFGRVESEFVWPICTSESIYPFRLGANQFAVVPCNESGLLKKDQVPKWPGLSRWWGEAQLLWKAHRRSDRPSLAERLNYQSRLSKQFPIRPIRVVFNRAGTHLVATTILERRVLIANDLYWAAVNSEAEADYLCAIINAPVATELVRSLMSCRDDEMKVPEHIWDLPIPLFNPNDRVHRRIAELGRYAEVIAARVKIDGGLHSSALRMRIRNAIYQPSIAAELDEIVSSLLS